MSDFAFPGLYITRIPMSLCRGVGVKCVSRLLTAGGGRFVGLVTAVVE